MMTTSEQTLQKIEQLKLAGLHIEADKLQKLYTQQQRATKPQTEIVPIETENVLAKFITQDKDMIELKNHIRKLVNRDYPVLIMGPSGTGKELIAKALHGDRSSGERNGKFVDINCAGLPEALIESELFGYVRGAFTGADRDSEGLIVEARHGTFSLDVVGDLPLSMQAKFLRFLQEGYIRKIGSKSNLEVKTRVVAATHHNLPELVNLGKFRLDLYARLCTFPLITKPLKDRRGDIKLIVEDLDAKGNCWRDVFDNERTFKDNEGNYKQLGKLWEIEDFNLNVRDIQRLVTQYKILGKVIG